MLPIGVPYEFDYNPGVKPWRVEYRDLCETGALAITDEEASIL